MHTLALSPTPLVDIDQLRRCQSIVWLDKLSFAGRLSLIAKRPRGTSIFEVESLSGMTLCIKQEQRLGSYRQERNALIRLNSQPQKDSEAFFPKLYGYSDKLQLFVLEKVSGKHFDACYYGGRLKNAERLQVGVQLINAFDALHSFAIAHCDTHHENIFYDESTGRVALIDYGSCGLGRGIEAVSLAKLRSPLCESKKRFYRAPELTQDMSVHGELAERYGIASQLYALVWGLQPLDDAYPERGDYLDPSLLWHITTRLPYYVTARHEPLLRAILTNFSAEEPARRRFDNGLMKLLLKEALA